MAYWVFLHKNASFGYFTSRIKKNPIAIFEITTLKFVEMQNFAKKTKLHKFGTKNTLFVYFCPPILKKILSYLKLATTNLSDCNISEKANMPNFVT